MNFSIQAGASRISKVGDEWTVDGNAAPFLSEGMKALALRVAELELMHGGSPLALGTMVHSAVEAALSAPKDLPEWDESLPWAGWRGPNSLRVQSFIGNRGKCAICGELITVGEKHLRWRVHPLIGAPGKPEHDKGVRFAHGKCLGKVRGDRGQWPEGLSYHHEDFLNLKKWLAESRPVPENGDIVMLGSIPTWWRIDALVDGEAYLMSMDRVGPTKFKETGTQVLVSIDKLKAHSRDGARMLMTYRHEGAV